VKVNPVPLPPAIDISLKDKAESNFTISYGLTSNASSNWISITDTKMDEFNALKQYLNPPSYTATFEITGEQLREIYCIDSDGNPLKKCKSPTLEKCTEIANLINKYSDQFEINTALRMSHFLGQVGWESDKLNAMGKKSGENPCYTEKNKAWDKSQSGWIATKKWSEPPIKIGCDDYEISMKGMRKNTWNSIKDVPKKYVCTNDNPASIAGKNLLSYVYRCEGGNSDENSQDGYTYRGHGILQLTWKKAYINFNTWLKSQGFQDDYKKTLSNPDEAFKDMEIDILSGMWYWDKTDCNETADKIESGSTQDEFDKITKKINTGLDASEKRKEIFEKAYSKLKK
jgi:predicted chitinase